MSWCDIDSLKVFTAVVRKSLPGDADLQETSDTVRLCDIAMTEHRIFVHFELSKIKEVEESEVISCETTPNRGGTAHKGGGRRPIYP